ncbi:MAG: DUF883 C-terminal domain-containing protein [Deltaproteobacteria bacterium]|nr:DUF883 C-terminal domain-containing protein [Deltaproteobacteria bacterium]
MSTNENGLAQHTADFRKKASDLGHNVEDLGSMTKVLAGDAVDKLQKNAGKYYDQGMKKAGSLEKGLEKTISENPLVSLLVAAGVGMVAGAFFNRR